MKQFQNVSQNLRIQRDHIRAVFVKSGERYFHLIKKGGDNVDKAPCINLYSLSNEEYRAKTRCLLRKDIQKEIKAEEKRISELEVSLNEENKKISNSCCVIL